MLDILSLVALGVALFTLNAQRGSAEKMAAEIRRLAREVEMLKGSGAALAEEPAASAEPQAAEAEPTGAAVTTGPWGPPAEVDSEAAAGRALFGGEASQDAAVRETAQAPVAAPPVQRESFESRIGARWAVWVGGVALALGGIFMVKYSIEAGLLSPAVRLTLAALFAALLIAAGEVVRRRAQPLVADAFRNAMIPGVLTAAGVVTLFAVSFVAYGVYGYFGPASAFLLLAAVSFIAIGLSLLHGQALAGLGLLASMITPALVATGQSRPSILFGFLTVAWLATLTAARLRRWQVVPALANLALAGWAILYLTQSAAVEVAPVAFSLLVLAAGLGLVWPGGAAFAEASTAGKTHVADVWERLLSPPAMAVSLSGALALFFTALAFAGAVSDVVHADYGFAVLALALAVLGASRGWAVYPAIFSAAAVVLGAGIVTALPAGLLFDTFSLAPPGGEGGTPVPLSALAPVNLLLGLAVAYALAGIAAVRLRAARSREFSALWSVLAPAAPFCVLSGSFAVFGNFSLDFRHGLLALALGLAFLAAAEMLSRRERTEAGAFVPQWTFAAGGFAFLLLALHALSDGLATTLGVAVLGALAVFATRLRRWPVLPWLMVGAGVVVAVRIAIEPTIVGAENLSRMPVLNQLLAGYGVPAALLALSAFELRRWPDERVRNLLQALASLFVLLTAAILVRHAMNGGVLDSAVPTLGEQSIYTLLVIGASAIMMSLDLKSPSPVFRYGSMAVGVVSVLSVASAHFIALNPYFSGELLGRIPVFDLLLIGYLLPGVAYAGLARHARGRRPQPYVVMLALAGVALVFAWITLSVRRYWQGESIADWKGFLQPETYTYSVVWLLLGVALLALGSRLDSKSIRLASAGLVLIAVVKVFLIDMSNLEGFLRALSFIGLGAVLIGIGLFYQKILSARPTGGETG
ncbi:DUF2339 domain-containing protein [Shinella daejeonensis]|uniref:DUF2339 domain-containing protein n=1 Tax=Shinella daejeonensis TaxID=659017 RepID=UPI0020C7FCA6|nr:DUF2339 domain-containing protein [Shinella daejeonensis]MCP8895746.1 DUF2339 domain-containing protein [Shinella daejeonensis]